MKCTILKQNPFPTVTTPDISNMSVLSSIDDDNIERCYSKTKSSENNKLKHTENGNVTKNDDNSVKIMQINTANSKFNTFKERLLQLIKTEAPKVIVISESNIDNDLTKIATRQATFPNYKFEDKFFDNVETARVTIMIRDDVTYKRKILMENDTNATIVIEI